MSLWLLFCQTGQGDEHLLKLVRGLADADAAVRESSWDRLGGYPAKIQEALVILLPELDAPAAAALAEFLAVVSTDAALESMIIRYAADPPEHVAAAVCRAVRANPGRASRVVSKRLSGERNDASRIRLIALLGLVKEPSTAGILTDLLSDKNDLVAGAARKVLVDIGRDNPEPVLAHLVGKKVPADVIERIQADLIDGDVERILDAMVTGNGSSGYYRGQFDEIKKMGNPAAVVLLRMAQNDKYSYKMEARSGENHHAIVRNLAIRALGEVGGEQVKEQLQRLAESDVVTSFTSEETMSLAHALFRRGEERYYRAILSRLHEALDQVKEQEKVQEQIEICNMLSHLYSRIEEHDKAIEMLKELIDATHTAAQTDAMKAVRGNALYNLACSYAMSNRRPEAIEALRRAFETGYKDREWIEIDKDLDNIRREKEFQNLIDEFWGKKK